MKKLVEYLDKELVFFLEAEDRDEALWHLINGALAAGKLQDKETFFTAVAGREKIVSTGIGMGVALPHAKIPGYTDFFIAVGVLGSGVEWHAIDEAPVRLVFLIGGPDDRQTEYLQVLSLLTQAIKNEAIRKKVLTEETPEGIIELFQDFDR